MAAVHDRPWPLLFYYKAAPGGVPPDFEEDAYIFVISSCQALDVAIQFLYWTVNPHQQVQGILSARIHLRKVE